MRAVFKTCACAPVQLAVICVRGVSCHRVQPGLLSHLEQSDGQVETCFVLLPRVDRKARENPVSEPSALMGGDA